MQVRERTGRRVTVICALGAVLAGALMTATPLSGRADQSVDMTVTPMWKGTVNAGSWVPVQVTVHNKGQEFRGRVQVSMPAPTGNGSSSCFAMGGSSVCKMIGGPGVVSGSAGTVDYAAPVVLAAGVTKTVTLTVLPSGSSIHAALVADGGGVVTSLDTDLNVAFGGQRVILGVVSSDGGALDAMGGVRLPGGAQVQVVHLRGDELPGSAVPLGTFDAVILDRAPTDTLAPAQIQALADYVNGGGSLLVVAGDSAKATLAGLPADLAAATLGGGSTGVTLRTLSAALGVNPPAGAAAAQNVHPHGTVVMRDGATPILVVAPHGGGQTALLTVDPGAEPLASWSGGATLLRQLVVRTTHAFDTNHSSRMATLQGFNSGPGTRAQLATESAMFGGPVSLIPGVTLPSAVALGFLAVAYIMLVGPIAYLLLRRLRRRDLFWLVVPLVAAGTTTVAYVTGLGASGRGLSLNEVRLYHLVPGSDRAAVDNFAAAFSPSGGDYQLQLAGASYVSGLPVNQDSGGVTVLPSGDQVLAQFHSPAAALRGYSATRSTQVGGRIDTSLHYDGQTLTGTVTNHLGVDLTNVVLLRRGFNGNSLGDIANGQTVQIQNSWSNSGGAMPMTSGGSAYYGQPVSDSEAFRQSQVLTSLNAVGNSTDGPVLTALARKPLLGSDVHGDGVDTTVLDAVVIPLSAAASSTAALHRLPAGLVDVEDTSPQASSAVRGQGTYQVSLPGGPGWQNVSVHIDNNNCSGNGVCSTFSPGPLVVPRQAVPVPVPVPLPAPGGTGGQGSSGFGIASPPQPLATSSNHVAIEAFDVRAGRWVDLAGPTWNAGDVPIPDVSRFVDGDGNLLVRVTGSTTATVLVSADPARAA